MLMQKSNGALSHYDLMKMPWIKFMGYVNSIANQSNKEYNKNYFNGSKKLANIWEQNKDKWYGKEVM